MATLVSKAEGDLVFKVAGKEYRIPKASQGGPGRVEIDDAVVEEARKHKVVAGWFAGPVTVTVGKPATESKPATDKPEGKPGKNDPK